ncbi:flagellar basal-body MS-ring/collar protein FliF [Marinobacteraceae bacterium S3BR75-40.1]
MASVPAEVNQANAPAEGEQQNQDSGRRLGDDNDLLFGFNRLSLIRQIGLMIGLAASVALGVAVVLWAQDPDYQPLLGDLQQYDPQEVTQVLDQAGIEYRLEPRSGALLVSSDQVYDARLKLAAAGVTENQGPGFEMLNQEQSLGTSQFMERARFRRSLEGELARTISAMSSVRGARVHLAIPKDSVFVRDNRQSKASVFVDVFAGRRLSHEQISAIVNLVAGSVPSMSKEDVAVVDQRGNLLSQEETDSQAREMADQFEQSAKYEQKLSNRIASILEPIIGRNRFRAEVSADLDFSNIEQAQELYNPDQQALRSEQVVEERQVGGGEGGVPGALSNQPPGNATAPELAQGQQAQGQQGQGQQNQPPQVTQQSKRATRNFEVDRTISYTRREKGQVNRLTVAVAVDDIKRVDPQTGEVSFEPWPEQELQRLTMLVRDAVGYSAARGDSVTVVNTPFAPEEQVEIQEPPIWEQPWVQNLIKPVLAGLVILILILTLVRPTLKNLASGGQAARDQELGYGEGMEGLESDGATSDAIKEALGGGEDLLLPGGSESYDRQVNALKGLVAEDPARVAQVVRQWVNAEE